MLKVYLLIVVLGLVGGVVYGGYYYYRDTQSRIQILTTNNAKLETAKQQQDATIQAMVKSAQKIRGLNKKLTTELQQAEKYRNDLIDKLRKHDLTRLSQKKPSLVEKKINNGTKKLFKQLEALTALPPASQ